MILSYLRQHLEEIDKTIAIKVQKDNEAAYEKYIGMYNIAKDFLKEKGLLLYGGLAINLALPKEKRFYGIYELPDYDFFSFSAKEHAKELAKRYESAGYKYIEVRPGIHVETYKVFVDFMPVADITDIPPRLFQHLSEVSLSEKPLILRNNPSLDLHIVPLSFLRLAFHIELSRPNGYIERWPKVYQRMVIFYNTYPLTVDGCDPTSIMYPEPQTRVSDFIEVILNFTKSHGIPIMGTEGIKIYLKNHLKRSNFDMSLIFDTRMPRVEIISEDYKETSLFLHKLMSTMVEQDETLVVHHHSPLNKSEFIPKHAVISLNKGGVIRHLCTVYNAQACYGYKVIDSVNLLTIDSMLSIMYAYMFTHRDYIVVDKVKCMINMLLNMQHYHIKSKKYIWKRFDLLCYGKQQTLEDVKRTRWSARKNQLYKTNEHSPSSRSMKTTTEAKNDVDSPIEYVQTATLTTSKIKSSKKM